MVLAACSGGDDDAVTTTSTAAVPSTASSTTSIAVVDPPPVPSTQPTQTTIGPATTTEPSAATIPADAALARQQVVDALIAAWEANNEAGRNPTDEAALAALADHFAGAALDRIVIGLSDLVAGGITAIPNPDIPASIDVDEASVVIDTEAGRATVESCQVGSDLGVRIGANPDGSDEIVIDEHNAYHELAELTFVRGRWVQTDGSILRKFEGAVTCDG